MTVRIFKRETSLLSWRSCDRMRPGVWVHLINPGTMREELAVWSVLPAERFGLVSVGGVVLCDTAHPKPYLASVAELLNDGDTRWEMRIVRQVEGVLR